MDIPGAGGCRCVRKGVRNLEPLFQKHIGLGFWMDFDFWFRLCKFAMKKGWEEGVPAFSGMNRWDPGSAWPGDEARIELC